MQNLFFFGGQDDLSRSVFYCGGREDQRQGRGDATTRSRDYVERARLDYSARGIAVSGSGASRRLYLLAKIGQEMCVSAVGSGRADTTVHPLCRINSYLATAIRDWPLGPMMYSHYCTYPLCIMCFS